MFYGCQEGQTGGGSGVAERPKGGGIVSQENCCQPSRASPVATDGRPLLLLAQADASSVVDTASHWLGTHPSSSFPQPSPGPQ